MITNDEIAEVLKLYSQLLEVHGEDAFRAKSYSNASFQIDRMPESLAAMELSAIAAQKGIGNSIAQKIKQIIDTGAFAQLQELLSKTPAGVLDMLRIKGIGPKKIHTIWHEMGIESPGELLYACNENRLIGYKGFGEKSQQSISDAIEFMMSQQGKLLLADALLLHQEYLKRLNTVFGEDKVLTTGAIARGEDVIESLDYIIAGTATDTAGALQSAGIDVDTNESKQDFLLIAGNPLPIIIHAANPNAIGTASVKLSSNDNFLTALHQIQPRWEESLYASEVVLFDSLGMQYVPPYLRTSAIWVDKAKAKKIPEVITPVDIKGIIHSHSKYSDGINSLEEMAVAAAQQGYEYLVISDHSKSAFYANGLSEERITEQHAEIDTLNHKLAPFKIFKSIESDILNDGSLDYSNEVLSKFDLVIASVHSNLKMTEDKAMSRLLNAIANPFTTILGHPTGRLLLSRAGYPVNHEKIIDACIAHNVVIEINAHPRRLDLEWFWVPYAIEKGAMLSIDPDAHWIAGFDDVKYGVLAARKGGLSAEYNLSSMTLAAFESFIAEQKKKPLK